MTTAEQLRREGEMRGEKRGYHKGLLETIEMGINLRFGSDSLVLMPFIEKIQSHEKLKTIKNSILTVEEYSEFQKIVAH